MAIERVILNSNEIFATLKWPLTFEFSKKKFQYILKILKKNPLKIFNILNYKFNFLYSKIGSKIDPKFVSKIDPKIVSQIDPKMAQKSTRKLSRKLRGKSARRLAGKSTRKLSRKSTRKLSRKSTRKLSRKSTRKLCRKSTRKLCRKSTRKLSRKLIRKSIQKLSQKSTRKLWRKSARSLVENPKVDWKIGLRISPWQSSKISEIICIIFFKKYFIKLPRKRNNFSKTRKLQRFLCLV